MRKIKQYKVNRITYSSIIIEAKSRKEADDIMGDIDGDDDNWSYYDEEFYLLEDNGKGKWVNIYKTDSGRITAEYDEYSMTHTAYRDDEVVKQTALKRVREGYYENKFSKSKREKTTGPSKGQSSLCVYGDT